MRDLTMPLLFVTNVRTPSPHPTHCPLRRIGPSPPPSGRRRPSGHRTIGPTHCVAAWPQAVDAADLSLLPGLFRALEQDFGVDPKGLATLVLSQSILKGLAYRALSPAVMYLATCA